MESKAIDTSTILSFIRGGTELDIQKASRDNPESLAAVITQALKDRKYHRKNVSKALISLIAYSPPSYRKIGWALLQRVPLSHLLELQGAVEHASKEVSNRLRHALVVKIANSEEGDILRAYFIGPQKFRSLFKYFKLPLNKFDSIDITHKRYLLASELAEHSIHSVLEKYRISIVDLVKVYGIPLHNVLQLVEDPEIAEQLAIKSKSDDFFRHAGWFKDIIGQEKFDSIVIEKVKAVKKPFALFSIRKHLQEKSVITPVIAEKLNERCNKFLEEKFKEFNLERIALIVDISGSMMAAKEITLELYQVFSHMKKNVTDLIAFNDRAFTTTPKRLEELKCSGMTSIGASLVLLNQRLKQRRKETYPQAILLVTDGGENTSPYMNNAAKLLNDKGFIPIIVLLLGRQEIRLDHPHAIIPIKSFHKSLVQEIVIEIIVLSNKVVNERTVTEVLVERTPVEEKISTIELPERPAETLQKGYLKRLLTASL
ncbi:MAG: hypothetical protein ACFFDI_08085 [Promethearchaeota archaeon]